MLGGKCPLCVGKPDPQAVARKLDEKNEINELIAKRKEVKQTRRNDVEGLKQQRGEV